MTDGTKLIRWSMDEVHARIVELEEQLRPVGFSVALTGSVLLKGFSDNDVDIIIYPRDSGSVQISLAYRALELVGLRQKASRNRVLNTWSKDAENNGPRRVDGKWVEKWITTDGRTVDVFFLS